MKIEYNSYKEELIKTISVILGLFVVSCVICAGIIANSQMTNFFMSVEKDKMLIISDFRKLHFSHAKQIKWLKSEIQQIGLDQQGLENFFNSDKANLIDQTSISAIIITDKNKNILYSNIINGEQNKKTQLLPERLYFKKIKSSLNQVVIGDIVTGVLTGLPSIPISISLTNTNNEFTGAVIFSITLDNLSKHLIKNSLSSILIKETSDTSSIYNDNILEKSSLGFFIEKILFNKKNSIAFTVLENLSDKYIELNYNPDIIRKDFLTNFKLNALLIFCILSLILAFYYYRILLPLRSASSIIDGSPLHIRSGNINLFSLVSRALEDQSKTIAIQETAYHEQILKLISIIHSFSAVTNYVKNKLDLLAEDISDANFDSSKLKLPKQYKKVLSDIEDSVIGSKHDIKLFFLNFIKISEILKKQDKEELDLTNILEQCGIDRAIINNYTVEQKIYKQLYKPLMETLIAEIIDIKPEILSLHQVNINDDRLDFIFRHMNNYIMINCDEKLVVCKIWGLFNNISIEIDNQESYFIISCYFNKKIMLGNSDNY